MSETAVKQPADTDMWELRVLGDTDRSLRSVGNERRIEADPVDEPFPLASKNTVARREEFEASIALVQEACDSIRLGEQRIQELENELEQAAMQTKHDLQVMLERIQSLQDELKAANGRTAAAEARATQAEEWLGRLNSAIMQGFGTQSVEIQQQIKEPA